MGDVAVALRPYQEQMLQRAREAVKGGRSRVLLVAPTGAGKTHIIAAAFAGFLERGHGSALYVVHRRQLVLQTALVLRKMGIPATILMAGHNTDWSHRVYIVSRDTWARRRDYVNFGDVDLLIFDEAHIGLGAQMRMVGALRPRVVLGFTATPISLTGPGMGALYQELVAGPSYGELIAMGYLVPTRWLVAQPLRDEGMRVSPLTGDYLHEDVVQVVKGQVLVDFYEAFAAHAGKRNVVFAPSVDIAATIAARLGNMGYPAVVLDWSTPPRAREEALRGFREGRIGAIVNVDVLSEGWDEPLVDTIFLASPTRSLARHLQRIGRGMRPAPGKGEVRIVDLVGSVFLHGAPEDILGWELEPARPERQKRAPNVALVKRKGLCPVCRQEMKAVPCQNCGFEPKYVPKLKDLEVVSAAKLVELGDTSPATRKAWYAMLLYWVREHGKKDGYAAHLYRERWGEWPEWRPHEVVPMRPSESVLRFIKHRLIRWAKRRPLYLEGRYFRRE